MLFPEEDQPGVDLILPDFTSIRDRLDDIDGIVLTHGHEDHIGGVPYLLRERPDIPLIGSKLTLALIEAKLQEHRIRPYTLEVSEGDRERIGPFDCEFIAVNHSIPDALAVAIRTPAGMVVHTGDFKMDQLPLDGRLTDLRAFARLGEEGIDLLLVDSTNAEVPGFVPPERDISPVLARSSRTPEARSSSPASPAMCTASSRSSTPPTSTAARSPSSAARWSATWASPATWATCSPRRPGRGRQDARRPAGRRGGAGLHGVAGRADGGAVPDRQPRPPDPDRRGRHRHPGVVADPGQRERGVPGDQRPHPVGRERRPQGQRHGARLRPRLGRRAAVPLQHLQAAQPDAGARRMAPPAGQRRARRRDRRPADRIVIAEDGVVVDLVDGVATIVGEVQGGYVYVDGLSVGDITETSLKDRRILGEEGFISVFVVVDSNRQGRRRPGDPRPRLRHDDAAFAAVIPVTTRWQAPPPTGSPTPTSCSSSSAGSSDKWVNGHYRRRPMIIPVVVEV